MSRLRQARRAVTLALLVGLASWSPASPETWEIPRSEETVRVDGVLDEPAWENALVFTLDYETDPGENIPPPVETECRMVYTRSHIFYGCHAFDPEPESIRARFSDRDRSFPTDDVVGLAIDPFNQNNTAFVFDVNALGIQNDRVYSEVAGFSDPSWDALWDSAGRIVEDGFVVEAGIPFSSLRFPRPDGGKQTWGFNFRRYHPREVFRRISIYPFDRDNSCRLCQSDELVGFVDVDQGTSLEITPTLVAVESSEIDEYPDGELTSDGGNLDPGLFVSWGMTPNLNLSGTINPDFSQVEADFAQLDFNRQFALFFPERRPFFLEGASFFDSRIRAVHTRTIADPNWGLKLTGQEGSNGIGLLAAEDAVTNILLPGSQGSDLTSLDEESLGGILRYRRDVGEASTVGLLVTARDADDYSNVVAGVDTKLRLTESDTIRAQYLRSTTRYPDDLAEENEQPMGEFDDRAISFRYEHNTRNWDARASYRDFGDGFRADLGFVPRVDFRMAVLGTSYEWYAKDDTWWTNIEVGGDWDRSETQDGEPLEEEWEAFAGFNGKLQSSLFFGGSRAEERYEGVDFDLERYWLFGQFKPVPWLRLAIEASSGDGIDRSEVRPGTEVVWSPGIGFTPGRHLQGSLFYTRNTFDLDLGELFDAAITELRLVYQINSRAFFRLIGQYYRLTQNPDLYTDEVVPRSEEIFGQLLFSYRLNARTALYLGYSSGYLDELDSGPVRTDETFFFKVSYAWTP